MAGKIGARWNAEQEYMEKMGVYSGDQTTAKGRIEAGRKAAELNVKNKKRKKQKESAACFIGQCLGGWK